MKSPRQNCFFHLSLGLYRVFLPGLVPNSPSSYSSSLSFSPCPRRVLTVRKPPPLKYVMLLWNIYCCSEICFATLKYALRLWNMYCCTKIYISSPKYVIQTACTRSQKHHYTVQYGHRHTNGSIPASYRPHVLLPSSYRVLTVCHRLYPPGEKFWVCLKLSPGLAGR